MTQTAVQEYLAAVRARYQQASKTAKGTLLDEICATTGWHRKSAIRRLGRNMQPGGGIGFLEPNRRNPLFLAQVACCADMTWAEEKDTFRLSRRRVERAYRDAALCEVRTRTCGFFPPQVLNRFASARSLEARIERLPGLGGILPFLLLSARAPADAGPGSS